MVLWLDGFASFFGGVEFVLSSRWSWIGAFFLLPSFPFDFLSLHSRLLSLIHQVIQIPETEIPSSDYSFDLILAFDFLLLLFLPQDYLMCLSRKNIQLKKRVKLSRTRQEQYKQKVVIFFLRLQFSLLPPSSTLRI